MFRRIWHLADGAMARDNERHTAGLDLIRIRRLRAAEMVMSSVVAAARVRCRYHELLGGKSHPEAGPVSQGCDW